MTSPLIDNPDELVRGHGETTWISSITAPAGRWRDVRQELPEECKPVLLALLCGEEWTGYLSDDGLWKYISDDPINEPVTHWLEYPAPPENQ